MLEVTALTLTFSFQPQSPEVTRHNLTFYGQLFNLDDSTTVEKKLYHFIFCLLNVTMSEGEINTAIS